MATSPAGITCLDRALGDYDHSVRRAMFNIARTIDVLGNPTIAEVIEDLCTQGSDEDYVITFTPHSHVRHALLP